MSLRSTIESKVVSDTPRTDAAVVSWSHVATAKQYVEADLARQLERELVAALGERDAAQHAYECEYDNNVAMANGWDGRGGGVSSN